ncbi:unnamed protein product [Heterobilharzia americana]|nr:unnamed protein product [Heterobilharzia americana]
MKFTTKVTNLFQFYKFTGFLDIVVFHHLNIDDILCYKRTHNDENFFFSRTYTLITSFHVQVFNGPLTLCFNCSFRPRQPLQISKFEVCLFDYISCHIIVSE